MHSMSILPLLIRWAALTLGFLAAAALIPGFDLKSSKSGIWVAAIYAIVNVVLAKVLAVVFAVASLGIACLFDGVTSFLISVILIKIVDGLSDLIRVKGWFPAVLAAVVLAVVGQVTEQVLIRILT